MWVLATAGHVDHGKSTLIEALTGIHPDRLAEEKARGMTIDLGFAWFTLPSGREVGVVDVPGHARFVKNMLAGVGGVDCVLFVVAANEGWMPQSEEHLAILRLLGVKRGVVALTKVDLVDDEWRELVQEDVAEHLAKGGMPGLAIVPVSATTGEGIPDLLAALDRAIDTLPPPPDLGRPRVWVDRVFTVRGVGTVVTGTLHGGALAVDDELEILPGRFRTRVRGLESHRRPVERAQPVRRVACNLAPAPGGDGLARGNLLARPGLVPESSLANAALRLLEGVPPLKSGAWLKVYVGTAERQVRVRVLEGQEQLPPGSEGFVQLRFDQPLPLEAGDRFILRDPSRPLTVGGGVVVNPVAVPVLGRRSRYPAPVARNPARVLLLGPGAGSLPAESLALRLRGVRGEPGALLTALLLEEPFLPQEALPALLPWPAAERQARVAALAAEGRVVSTGSYLLGRDAWKRLAGAILTAVAEHHARQPLAPGLSRETLRSRLGLPPRLFEESVAVLVRKGRLAAEGSTLRLPDFRVRFGVEEEAEVERLLALLRKDPVQPPREKELVEEHGISRTLIRALAEQGELVRVAEGLYFLREAVEHVKTRVREYVQAHGAIDVATLRDLLNTSRKYALPLLEYLDQVGFTRRVGDRRVLRDPSRSGA